MPAVRIVPPFNEIEDLCAGVALILEAMKREQLAFERGVEALAHRIIVAITNGSHRRSNPRFLAVLAERDRSILASSVRVVNHVLGFAAEDCHVEGFENEFGAQMIGHRPTDNAAAVDVEIDRKVQKAGPRRNVGDVSDPDLIGTVGFELAIDEIGCRPGIAIADRRNDAFAPRSAFNSAFSHQSRNTLAGDLQPFIDQIGMDSWPSVGAPRVAKDRFDPISQRKVGFSSIRRRPFAPCIKAAGRNVQRLAETRNGIHRLIRLYESEDLSGIVCVSRANQAAGDSTGQRNAAFSLLAGVLYCKVFLGRWFGRCAMRLRST